MPLTAHPQPFQQPIRAVIAYITNGNHPAKDFYLEEEIE